METHVIENTEKIYYRTIGQGKPILLVHGYLANGEMFNPIIPYLENQYQLIIPDIRGHGKSSKVGNSMDIKELSKDLNVILEDLQIHEPVHLLGYSKGGIISQQFVKDFGHKVKTLVLCCTFSYKPYSVSERMQKTVVPYIVKRLGAKGLSRYVFKAMSGGQEMNDEDWQAYKKMITMCDDKKIYYSVRTIMNFDSRDWLKNITQPTLVISSKEDLVVPPHHQEFLAANIPNARLRSIEGAGHALIFTHTEKFVNLLLKFWSEFE